MKYILIISLLNLGTSLCLKKKTHLGNWELELVKINNETIFDRDNYSISLQYNYSLNNPKTKDDSIAVENLAKSKFDQSRSLNIHFDTDSTFITTKVRSGGRIDPNTEELGDYRTSNDSLYMEIPTRNNYKMLLNYNRKKDFIYSTNEAGERTTYIQYRRIK